MPTVLSYNRYPKIREYFSNLFFYPIYQTFPIYFIALRLYQAIVIIHIEV